MARSAKDHKTNALRELAATGLPHEALFFEADPSMTGVEIAHAQGEEVDAVFKTLVAEGKSGAHYVFLVPVAAELDLKKAAAAAGEKAVSMVKARELLPDPEIGQQQGRRPWPCARPAICCRSRAMSTAAARPSA